MNNIIKTVLKVIDKCVESDWQRFYF